MLLPAYLARWMLRAVGVGQETTQHVEEHLEEHLEMFS